MNKKILHIAVPSIVSNVTVPLLGLADTAIAGHLGAASYIGAIAVGGMLFNMAYWLFGFLRMGTGGLTAQACGAGNREEQIKILRRAVDVALFVSVVLIALQDAIVNVAFLLVEATPEVEAGARTYFSILIWGAPAVLLLYAFTGWFLGMQNARAPMVIAIFQNVVNIAASLTLVVGCGWKVEGVATGTLVAQYGGFFVAFVIFFVRYNARFAHIRPMGERRWQRADATRFFAVNRDIFLRTLCLIAVTTYFTSAGAAMGESTLAANALLMQFFLLFSYFTDGFAYAGEALGGRYVGASDRTSFTRLLRQLAFWAGTLSICFAAIYGAGGKFFLHLLTDEAIVVAEAVRYLPAICLMPAAGVTAFLLDGVFIGITATRPLLLSMVVSTVTFFSVVLFFDGNNTVLWTAFLCYLSLRGSVLAWWLYRNWLRFFIRNQT